MKINQHTPVTIRTMHKLFINNVIRRQLYALTTL